MHLVTESQKPITVDGASLTERTAVSGSSYPGCGILWRNGAAVNIDADVVSLALIKTVLAIESRLVGFSARIGEVLAGFSARIVAASVRRQHGSKIAPFEHIQDQLGPTLTRPGTYKMHWAFIVHPGRYV